jgi:aspartyl-tRNA(Asn)/glutamyl-tRNA(Gln) amidotransferase subunit A
MGVSGLGPAGERVEATLGVVERLNPTIGAYLHLDLEGSRAAAAEQDAIDAARETRRGAAGRGAASADPSRPLAGMPICVKDIVDVAGMPTTAGAAGWVRHPDADAVVVERLRTAGAVVIGKGNTNEFACGIDGRNPHRGDCRNPYDPGRLSGGSSSGPAAAVASGMAAAAVGSDTSGSIRTPAALCGVVGIRPTRGLVPTDGVVPLAWSLDAVGPLATDVATAALVLDAMADRESPTPRPQVEGLRIGLATELVGRSEEPVADAIGTAVEQLRARGAEVIGVALPDLGRAIAIHRIVQCCEVAAVHAPWFAEQRERYAPEVRARIEPGYRLGAEVYLRAQRHRRLFTRAFAAAMRGLDAILTPASPVLAPPVAAEEIVVRGERLRTRVGLLSTVAPFSQLDGPAVSVPAGLREGLPVGLQVLGRPHAEEVVLRIAMAVEAAAGPIRPIAL